MIVRGTATAAKQSHRVLLALPHRAHARSSDVERSGATNEGAGAECSRLDSGATPASAAAGAAGYPSAEAGTACAPASALGYPADRKSTRLNSSHRCISYAV